MVVWNKEGQGYFDFDSIDFQGALMENMAEINELIEARSLLEWGSIEFKKVDSKINYLIKICQYIELLKWRKKYNG